MTPRHEWVFEAIGTRWQVDTPQPVGAPARHRVGALIDTFDRTYSRFRDDSTVAEIARRAGTFPLGPESGALLDLYRALHALTDGAMSPLVGGALDAVGHGAGLPSPGLDGLSWSGGSLTVARPTTVDVSAAGKGLLADLVADLVGAPVVVDASGDIVTRGAGVLRVGLEHPFLPGRVVGVAEVKDAALCASATNRRRWGPDLHHVLDARTGRPTAEVEATWVVAADGMTADALATALFFADPRRLAGEFDYSFARLWADGRLEYSANWPGEVFA